MGGMLEVLKRFLDLPGQKEVLLAGNRLLPCVCCCSSVIPGMEKKKQDPLPGKTAMEGQITEVNAFFDTGNSLYDPIAQKPVSIIQKRNSGKLCDADTMEKLQEFQRGKAEKNRPCRFGVCIHISGLFQSWLFLRAAGSSHAGCHVPGK